MLKLGDAPNRRWCNLDAFGAEMPSDDTPCVAFNMRPANGVDEGIAETMARSAIKKMTEGAMESHDYALETIDWAEAIQSGNAPLLSGIGYVLFATELAMLIGDGMKGVEGEDGRPAEWNRRNVSMVLRARRSDAKPLEGMERLGSLYTDTFMAWAMTSLNKARAEGKP